MQFDLVGGERQLREKLDAWGYKANSLETSIALYQANHAASLTELTQVYHGRAALIDGDVGPATAQLINTRFCSVPDIMPGALPAVMEARWPDACVRDITISWNFANAPALTIEQTNAVWASVEEEYGRLFEMVVRLLGSANYGQSRINADLRPLGGSILAWSYLAQNNCASRLQQAYNSSTRWTPGLSKGTWKHECGHAFGMDHTPGDRTSLMYPSMNGQVGLNATDINQMLRLGYKRRTSPPPGDDWGMF